MNKSKFLALLWVVLVAWTMAWCGNNTNVDNEINNDNNDLIIEDVTESANAVIDYNDSLVDLAYNCIASEDTIWTAYNSEELNVENIQNAISNTVAECNSAINQIESLGNWEWDSSLKDGVITLLQKDKSTNGFLQFRLCLFFTVLKWIPSVIHPLRSGYSRSCLRSRGQDLPSSMYMPASARCISLSHPNCRAPLRRRRLRRAARRSSGPALSA